MLGCYYYGAFHRVSLVVRQTAKKIREQARKKIIPSTIISNFYLLQFAALFIRGNLLFSSNY